jgi:hypothetical protein
MDPAVGLSNRVRLTRDYYVRVDSCDYSVDPRMIGRFVVVTASPSTVTVSCDGQVVARHRRSWAKHEVVRDPAHVATAAVLRRDHQQRRDARQRSERAHADGHTVVLRALPDYDALFGVDFTAPARTPTPEATSS